MKFNFNINYIMVLLCVLVVYVIVYSVSFSGFNPDLPDYDLIIDLQENIVESEYSRIDLYNENKLLNEKVDLYDTQINMLLGELEGKIDVSKLVSADVSLASPADRISYETIAIDSSKATVRSHNIRKWFIYDTNSMVPVMDVGSTVLTVEPKSFDDISIGDIIFFKVDEYDAKIVHRVIRTSYDRFSPYYVTKGDNNLVEDPFRVRFEDVEGVVIGIIY